jgi:hypothetical protein
MFSKLLENNQINHYPYGIVGGRIGIQVWRFRIALECDFALKHGLSSEETSTALNLSFTF